MSMDPVTTASLRRALRDTPWPAAARSFLGSIARGGHEPGGLLTVGTPEYEPWHLTAHLRDDAELRGDHALVPTLVRRAVPANAPRHLRHGMERLEEAGRGATVLVVSPLAADEGLLQRVQDARRRGSTLLAMTTTDPELVALTHDALVTGHADEPEALPFEVASHLVSLGLPPLRRWRRRPHLNRELV
jgi:hypothetical protein